MISCMTNYNYKDLTEEFMKGKKIVNRYLDSLDFEENASSMEKTGIDRSLNALEFYTKNKNNFNKQEQECLEILIRGLSESLWRCSSIIIESHKGGIN